jgi:hypothetical protein
MHFKSQTKKNNNKETKSPLKQYSFSHTKASREIYNDGIMMNVVELFLIFGI